MSSIWGIQHSRMTLGAVTVELEHSIIEPNFMLSDAIMHESALTGVRTWSKGHYLLEFSVMEYLFKYSDPVAKANEILALEDNVVSFTLAIDGALTHNMYLEAIEIHSLYKPYAYDVAVLNFKSEKYLNISRYLKAKDGKLIKTADGKYIKTQGIVI